MPEYDLFGDTYGKFCALVWLFIIFRAHHKSEFPLKFRGFDVLITYTKWRMYMVLGVPFVLMGIPVFFFGMDYGELMSARDYPLTFLIFWSSVILIPTSCMIATVAQILANNREKPKRKIGDFR